MGRPVTVLGLRDKPRIVGRGGFGIAATAAMIAEGFGNAGVAASVAEGFGTAAAVA